MAKVIMVLSDGLRDDVAAQQMGYLEHLVETRRATRYTVVSELPSLSRPLYETLHTGVGSSEHGVTANSVSRRSTMPNVFEIAHQHGLKTAAVAYSFYSELYNRAPYDMVMDREVDDETLNIQYGRFYSHEPYPDQEVFATGQMLMRRFSPDYLLIHPMTMDTLGERYGGDSPEYRRQAIVQSELLAVLIPEALKRGYSILVTADHGMSDDTSLHGGTQPQVRQVPLYIIKPGGEAAGKTGHTISQLRIAPTLCALLGVPIPETMKHPPIP